MNYENSFKVLAIMFFLFSLWFTYTDLTLKNLEAEKQIIELENQKEVLEIENRQLKNILK